MKTLIMAIILVLACLALPATAQETMEAKYIGTWCRVASELDTLERIRRGQKCSPERQLIITAREMHGVFARVSDYPTTDYLEFKMTHCTVERSSANMNDMLWVWFTCDGERGLRNVFLISEGKLIASRELLRDAQ
jgi:hypothetical protein